jgi:hypothetical protein
MEIHDGGKGLPQMQKCPGRQGLPLKEWAAGQIEATPHGFAAMFLIKSMREAGLSYEQKEERNPKNVSRKVRTGVMEHYRIARGPEAVSQEYAKGKRAGYTGGPTAVHINVLNPADPSLPGIV